VGTGFRGAERARAERRLAAGRDPGAERLYAFCDRFDYLEDEDGRPVKNPMRKIEMPKPEAKSIQWLRADEEEEGLFAACETLRERILVGFFRFTGRGTSLMSSKELPAQA
jgi:hypothetical protein